MLFESISVIFNQRLLCLIGTECTFYDFCFFKKEEKNLPVEFLSNLFRSKGLKVKGDQIISPLILNDYSPFSLVNET